MTHDCDDQRDETLSPEAPTVTEPEVFAVRRDGELWRLSKREVLLGAAMGAVTTVAAGCTPGSDDEKSDDNDGPPDTPPDGPPGGSDAAPPFAVGGVTYQIVRLDSYNDTLISSGKNLTVIAFINSDFYFRHFDSKGRRAVNIHESKAEDKVALGKLKQLVQTVSEKASVEPAEQTEIADLFAETTQRVRPGGGRRMQGTEAKPVRVGRRMQGSMSSGSVFGRRLQGAEGRIEAQGETRNLGALKVNNRIYEDSRIVETYSDGYTKVAHSGGEVVVRSDALPEIVQLQLPHPIPNPNPLPTAIPRTATVPKTVTAPTPTPKPKPPRSSGGSGSTSGTYGGHYWRPN
ncbi:MAG: hypothetical protein IT367_16440 [Candidatus Hydrogenedentes bacterium]|nr:hypothetical protein [Candidatus Hydrogenedentota bacterium]